MATPTGTVTVVDTISGNTVASGTLDASGNASLAWTAVAGTYNFVANYSGDANFDPGTSAPIPYTVTAVLQTVTVNLTATPASPQTAGTAVEFAASVVGA